VIGPRTVRKTRLWEGTWQHWPCSPCLVKLKCGRGRGIAGGGAGRTWIRPRTAASSAASTSASASTASAACSGERLLVGLRGRAHENRVGGFAQRFAGKASWTPGAGRELRTRARIITLLGGLLSSSLPSRSGSSRTLSSTTITACTTRNATNKSLLQIVP
jgi:hypothetical protein